MQRGISALAVLAFLGACHESGAPNVDDGGTSADTSMDARMSFDAPADLESIGQACEEGHMSTADWLPRPESLLSPEAFGQSHLIAVLARRTSGRALVHPWLWNTTGDVHVAYCQEGAGHEVVDGLGWTDEERLDITASIGRFYTSLADGSRHPTVDNWTNTYFDAEWESLAADETVYLLILNIHEPGIYYLSRRIALVEDASGALVASGEYTLSGEAAPIDAFRAP